MHVPFLLLVRVPQWLIGGEVAGSELERAWGVYEAALQDDSGLGLLLSPQHFEQLFARFFPYWADRPDLVRLAYEVRLCAASGHFADGV
jgi:hypothetical protein